MPVRTSVAVACGALAAVGGWAAWSSLSSDATSAPPLAATAQAVETPAPPPSPAPSTPRPVTMVAAVASAAPAVASAPAPLRDGLVMQHRMPTAVHALAPDARSPAPPPPDVALPAGVRPEDASVNGAGMVTLTRSGGPGPGAEPAPVATPRVESATSSR